MKHVIILSDTHGLLRPEVLDYLSQQEITFAVMTVDGGHIQVEKVIIPHEKK